MSEALCETSRWSVTSLQWPLSAGRNTSEKKGITTLTKPSVGMLPKPISTEAEGWPSGLAPVWLDGYQRKGVVRFWSGCVEL